MIEWDQVRAGEREKEKAHEITLEGGMETFKSGA